MAVSSDREANLKRAGSAAAAAGEAGADLLALPEMFTCPYATAAFQGCADTFPAGPSFAALSEMAAANHLVVVGGSVPELAAGRLYNSCYTFGPHGEMLGRHRKVHLFDVDLPGGLAFMESATFSPGQDIVVLETPLGRLGVAVCYDIRFPELVRRLAMDGAWLVLVPAAFNLTTGPAHWGLTLRARAVDNQVFVAGVSRARVAQDPYVAYAHSMVVDPWGKVLGEAGTEEHLLLADVNPGRLPEIRGRLPLLAHRRPEVYGQ